MRLVGSVLNLAVLQVYPFFLSR